MGQDVLSSVAENLGIVAAAERALRQKTFTEAAETLFLARWRELDWSHLLGWLSHEPFEGCDRPVGEIVVRIVERVPRDAAGFTFFEVPAAVARVRDPEVRDFIVEQLRPHLDEIAWCHLTQHAVGGPVFAKVRNVELGDCDSEWSPPDDAFVDGKLPCSLISLLFEDRRDDSACIRLLGERMRDPKLRLFVLWVLSVSGLLAQVGKPADVLGKVPTLAEIDVAQLRATQTLVSIARSWPDTEALRTWLVSRWASAIERGVPWESLWWEIDADLRDDVAFATPRRSPLPLVLGALSRRFSGNELWARTFPLLEEESAADASDVELFNRGLQRAALVLGREVTEDDVQEAFELFDIRSVTAWIMNTTLPADADEAFDKRYVAVARRWSKWVVLDDMLADRLLTLPLTTGRARTIITLTSRSSSSRFWAMDRCVEIAEAAVKNGVVEDVPIPLQLDEKALSAYRILVGAVADERLTSDVDARMHAGDFFGALAVAEAIPTRLDPARRERLRALALALPISTLVHIQQSSPWLLDESDVVREASRADRQWGKADHLPAYLVPVITARAVTSNDERLARSLLEQLETLGVSRREILSLVLERIRSHGVEAIEPSWLSKRLDTRSLWEKEPGRAIIAALLGDGNAEGANTLLQLCFESARSENAESLIAVAHTVIAELLTDLARSTLDRRDVALAKRALAGIAHLSPGMHVRGGIRALRKLTTDTEVERLIAVNEDLLRREDNLDVPSLDAIHDALREVAFRHGGPR